MSAKNRIFLCLWVFTNSVFTQNYQQIKTRFDNLLNYHGGLNKEVEITPDKIVFYNPQKKVVLIV